MKNDTSSTAGIQPLFQGLYQEDTGKVKETLEEIGRMGKGNQEAMKALQEFLRRERRMSLRILAAQIISQIKEYAPPPAERLKKPGIFQCPGAEKIKRVEIVDVTCPHCHKQGTASVAGFEHEFTCELCGRTVQREVPESCIEKCPVGSECVGEERYQKYLNGRKKARE
ncbi:MAG: hypothetical protein EX330_10340 [Candidatus Brocadia sp. BROELEC01]|nr:hypothetical protein [Candidatus Brocadia sapporoensis]QQR65540.1 MAG: hypothetical protein IPI25_08020 [Candidatus Brocadia sp.]RZV57262.1 MAG: hypothetical protein EX330_10340 [Candidatus Brocadia sp. BROELEC01]